MAKLANDVSFIPHFKGGKEELEKDARKGQRKKKSIWEQKKKAGRRRNEVVLRGRVKAKQANLCQAGQHMGLESLILSSYDYIL